MLLNQINITYLLPILIFINTLVFVFIKDKNKEALFDVSLNMLISIPIATLLVIFIEEQDINNYNHLIIFSIISIGFIICMYNEFKKYTTYKENYIRHYLAEIFMHFGIIGIVSILIVSLLLGKGVVDKFLWYLLGSSTTSMILSFFLDKILQKNIK